MTHGNRTISLVLLIAVAVTTAAAQHDPFPDGAGKDELLGVCADCHGPDVVLVTRKTREQWVKVLGDMAALGVQGTPDQFERIERYLERNFAVVKVNVADVDELAATLGVSKEVAAAIVEHRSAHGSFTSIDGLRKISGLLPETVDAVKDRILLDLPKGVPPG